MPRQTRNDSIEIVAGGVTQAILGTDNTEVYKLFTSAAVTLLANVTISDDGTWVEGMEQEFIYSGNVNLNGFNLTVFGYSLTQDQATAGNLRIKAFNTGGAFLTSALAAAGKGQVGTTDLAPLSVTTAILDNLAVTSGKIALGAVDTPQIAAGAVTNTEVDNAAAIAYGKLALTNSLLDADIFADANVAVSKLEAAADGDVITGDSGSGKFVKVPLSAAGTIANTGALTIQPAVITPENGTTNLNTQAITRDINFDDASGKASITMGENFTLTDIWINLNKAAAFNISVAININGVAVTGGVVAFTAADPANTNNQGTAITANNIGAAGDVVNFILTVNAAETATGSVSLIYRKTS